MCVVPLEYHKYLKPYGRNGLITLLTIGFSFVSDYTMGMVPNTFCLK